MIELILVFAVLGLLVLYSNARWHIDHLESRIARLEEINDRRVE